MTSGRRTGQLHAHRVSVPATIYFVTCCTLYRRQDLADRALASSLLAQVVASDHQQDTETIAFTIMPDHCHWLFRQGNRLSLGRVVARLKARTGVALAAKGLGWQRDFYEHRLLAGEDPEDYALYMFLNPYRAALVSWRTPWPWWWSPQPGLLRFLSLLEPDGCPPMQWVNDSVPAWVRHGE